MIGRDDIELSVALEHRAVDDLGRRYLTVRADGCSIGQIVTSADQGWLRVTIEDDGVGPTTAQWRAVLHAVTALAQAEHYPGVVLTAGSQVLLRHSARSAGYVGPLRGDLSRDFRGPPAGPVGDTPVERFVSDLNALLPGVTVSSNNRPGRWIRSVVRAASSGVDGIAHLSVGDTSGAKPLRLAVPVGTDVMAEGVGRAVDTALAVRRRFHPLVDAVRISYDHVVHGLRTGAVAGVAAAAVRDIHLNPGFALAGELEVLEQQGRERQLRLPRGQPQRRPPLTVLAPFTRIESVVAHELWHQIEFGFESSRYRDSVELRRMVGAYFGVETLEHVIKGASPGSPEGWQVARSRLAEEVSAYATSGPKEATAELFAQWWCTRSAPPPSSHLFGEVLRRFFPWTGQ